MLSRAVGVTGRTHGWDNVREEVREEVGQRDAPTSFLILQGEKREENLRKLI